jgi:hypothetical protein
MVPHCIRFWRPALVLTVSLATLAASIAISFVAPREASAEVYTCGKTSGSNYHAGYIQAYGTGNYEGAAATIVTQYGAVCDTNTSNGNFTNSYSMIASNADSIAGWVQSGFIRWYDGDTYYFAQSYCGRGSSCLNTRFGTSPLTYGSSHTYYQRWFASCGCVESHIDSTLYLTTTWDPYVDWALPFSPQFEAETLYLESDIPGNKSNVTLWTGIEGQNGTTDNWVSYPCNTLTHENNGAAERSDGESWWDQPTGTCPDFRTYTGTAGN